jgi:hypothetical protein
MIKKEVKTKIKVAGIDNVSLVEEQYEDEPITKNICSSINDFHNLMHLLKKSWVNRKYHLRMEEAGYNIYDKNEELVAWIGIKEKYECIMFIIYYYGMLSENAQKDFSGPRTVFDFNEDLWVYDELKIVDIVKEENIEKQKKIIKNWINRKIKKTL